MYKIVVKITAAIDGCPAAGLAAVDFRAAAGLPAAPTNTIALTAEFESEALCRAYPGLTDDKADLRIMSHSRGLAYDLAHRYTDSVDPDGMSAATLPAAVIGAFLADPAAALPDLIAVRRLHIAAVAAETARRRAAAAAEKLQKAATAAAERLQRAAKAEAKAEARAEGVSLLRAWAAASASDLTRARITEGYDCWVSSAADDVTTAVETAVTAAAATAVVDVPDGYDVGADELRLCPTLREIAALRAVRGALAEATADLPIEGVAANLHRLTYTPESDDEGNIDLELEEIIRTEIVVVFKLCTGETSMTYYGVSA